MPQCQDLEPAELLLASIVRRAITIKDANQQRAQRLRAHLVTGCTMPVLLWNQFHNKIARLWEVAPTVAQRAGVMKVSAPDKLCLSDTMIMRA